MRNLPGTWGKRWGIGLRVHRKPPVALLMLSEKRVALRQKGVKAGDSSCILLGRIRYGFPLAPYRRCGTCTLSDTLSAGGAPMPQSQASPADSHTTALLRMAE